MPALSDISRTSWSESMDSTLDAGVSLRLREDALDEAIDVAAEGV